jgi:hypothetical protein
VTPFTSDSFRFLFTGYSTNKGISITMKSTLLALAVTLPAEAGHSCTSRKSGSYTISAARTATAARPIAHPFTSRWQTCRDLRALRACALTTMA